MLLACKSTSHYAHTMSEHFVPKKNFAASLCWSTSLWLYQERGKEREREERERIERVRETEKEGVSLLGSHVRCVCFTHDQ